MNEARRRARRALAQHVVIAPAVPVPYIVSDVESPGLPYKNLEVFNNVANCTTAPRPIANITALFDNVFLNQSALP